MPAYENGKLVDGNGKELTAEQKAEWEASRKPAEPARSVETDTGKGPAIPGPKKG